MIDADIAFHLAIYDASHNPLIADTARVHLVHLRWVMGAMLQSSGQRRQVWDEHEAIADAIRRGDVARAMNLSEQHLVRIAQPHSHDGPPTPSRTSRNS